MMIKILVNLPSGIGDAIQSTIGLRIIEQNYPSAYIVVLCEPYIVNLLSRQFSKNIKFVSNNSVSFFEKKQQFDVLLDFNGLPRLQTKIETHQFNKRIAHTCFTDPAIMDGANCIYIDDLPVENSRFFDANGYQPKEAWTLYADMAKLLLSDKESFQLPADTQPKLNFKKLASKKSTKKVIGLFLSGSSKTKHWSICKYLSLIKLLKMDNAEIRVFLGKTELCYMKHLKNKNAKVIFKKPIDKVFELNRDLDFSIANDTGLMHICGAFGIGTLGIFLETTPKVWFTYLANNQGYIKNTKYSSKRQYQSSPSLFDVYRYFIFLNAKQPCNLKKHFKTFGQRCIVRDK